MIASLQMYKRPELVEAHDHFWKCLKSNLKDAGINAPDRLAQDVPEDNPWLSPDLVFAQTCGMPYRLFLHGKVTLIGTPDYAIPSCPPAHYKSAAIVNKNNIKESISEYKNALFAYNGKHSQSGYASAYNDLKKEGFFFENQTCSGGHLNSAKLVASGNADIAYVDAMSLKLIEEHEDFYDDLHILRWSDPVPGLPYITALGSDQKLWFNIIHKTIKNLDPVVAQKLHLKGFVYIPAEEYLSIPNPPSTSD
jgi:hypothetical protein